MSFDGDFNFLISSFFFYCVAFGEHELYGISLLKYFEYIYMLASSPLCQLLPVLTEKNVFLSPSSDWDDVYSPGEAEMDR